MGEGLCGLVCGFGCRNAARRAMSVQDKGDRIGVEPKQRERTGHLHAPCMQAGELTKGTAPAMRELSLVGKVFGFFEFYVKSNF